MYGENKMNEQIVSEEAISNTGSDIECLEKILIDIECLTPLNKWLGEFNIFDILKITRNEIRHSNILAWLINPSESHGFGDEIIKKILCDIVLKNKTHFASSGLEYIHFALMDFDDLTIQREIDNIDLLLSSESNKVVVCIENKIGADEHSNQLEKYENKINSTYPEYKKIFVFLTPDGKSSVKDKNWVSYSYNEILNILSKAILKENLDDSVKILINNYIGTVRRYVMKDEEMVKICNDIYKKHKRALDLIYENKLDITSTISQKIQDYCLSRASEKKDIIFNPQYSVKTYVRFTTNFVETLIPFKNGNKSGWGNEYNAFYEIVIRENIAIKLTLCSINQDGDTLAKLEKLCKIALSDKAIKPGWQWKNIKSWKLSYFKNKTISDFELDAGSLDDDFDKIIKQIDEIITKDIPEFEATVREKWGE